MSDLLEFLVGIAACAAIPSAFNALLLWGGGKEK